MKELSMGDAMQAFVLGYRYGIPLRMAQILVQRGIGLSEAEAFLHSQHSHLHDPFLLPDMQKALDRIVRAIKENENILIYGDFDADGITSTAILYDVLRSLTPHVDYYIPNRLIEGYDLGDEVIAYAAEKKQKLMVTVDCGTKAVEPALKAKELGLDVIITDHHKVGEEAPAVWALVNPKRADSKYPFNRLAGVGVVYKLIQALASQFPQIIPETYLDLVALGTVADVVPLVGENRTLVKLGLSRLALEERPGVSALCQTARVSPQAISSWHISFVLAPRINAAGRLGDATLSLELLMSKTPNEALKLASKLETRNRERREICDSVYRQAKEMMKGHSDAECIILSSDTWHPGVIGIVAARLAEEFIKPAVLITTDTNPARGSARAIEGIDVVEALSSAEDLLIRFGGHQDAAGFIIDRQEIPKLEERLRSYVNQKVNWENLLVSGRADIECELSEIDESLAEGLSIMEPFGVGNPEPIICIRSARLLGQPEVLRERHLRFQVTDGQRVLTAVAFNRLDLLPILTSGQPIGLTGKPYINVWNGVSSLEFRVREVITPLTCEPLEIRKMQPTDALRIFNGKVGKEDVKWLLIGKTDGENIRNKEGPYLIERKDIEQVALNWEESAPAELLQPGWDAEELSAIKGIIFLSPPVSRQELALLRDAIHNGKIPIYMAFGSEVVQEEIENLKQLYPERKELINIYKAMLEVDSLGPHFDTYGQYLTAVGEGLSPLGVQKAIFIFQDLGLIHREGMVFRPTRASQGDKVELDDSPHYRICQAERNGRYHYLKSLL
jgi:single-stranded-DNA-specific exonuclease RecJ